MVDSSCNSNTGASRRSTASCYAMAPRSQTPTNGAALRKQSLKLGVPDPRVQDRLAMPRQRPRPLGAEGPGTPNGVGARTGPPPGLSCSRLVHGTARKGLRRAGTTTGREAAHALVNPQPSDRKSRHRNGTQTTHNPTAPGWNPLLAVRAGRAAGLADIQRSPPRRVSSRIRPTARAKGSWDQVQKGNGRSLPFPRRSPSGPSSHSSSPTTTA
jgi:hypothetical protein